MTDSNLTPQAVAEAIFRAASLKKPKSRYFVDAPGDTYVGLTIPEVLQIVHCEPVDKTIGLAVKIILSGVPPVPVPCTPVPVPTCSP
jgi:hypothetical protein